jgi:hypothetical protein
MLDEIRASGETQNSACDVFNANLGEYTEDFHYDDLYK